MKRKRGVVTLDPMAQEVVAIVDLLSPQDGDVLVIRVPEETPNGLAHLQDTLAELHEAIPAKLVILLLNGEHDLQHIPKHKAVELLQEIASASDEEEP